jgi:hypothetical protein
MVNWKGWEGNDLDLLNGAMLVFSQMERGKSKTHHNEQLLKCRYSGKVLSRNVMHQLKSRFTLKMEAARPYKMLLSHCNTTQHHNPEDLDFNLLHCENLKSYIKFVNWCLEKM